MTRPMVLLAATLLVVEAGCGASGSASGSRATAEVVCPVHDLGDETVEVELTLSGNLDIDRAEAMIERFHDSQDEVRVDARILDHQEPVDDLLARSAPGDGPALATVPADHLAALAAVGAIEPMAPCITADAYGLDPFLPEALTTGQLAGVQWAMPANVATHVLVYDRDAFTRAGLDPARPPATLAELETASAALRASGFEHPIWLPFLADLVQASGLPYRDGARTGFEGPEGREIAEAVARLGAAGYLLPEEPGGSGLPPIGEGRVAMQVDSLGGVWGLADALAHGQAPGRHLDVAPLPGLHAAGSPVFAPNLLVLGAGVTPTQRAAAWRFVTWIEEPANQADLHITTDLLPSGRDATRDDALAAYWDELPLLRRAWQAMIASPRATSGDGVFPGALAIVHDALAAIAFEGAPASRLDEAAATAAEAIAALDRWPRAYIDCVRTEAGEEC